MEKEKFLYQSADGEKIYSTEKNFTPEETAKLLKEQQENDHKIASSFSSIKTSEEKQKPTGDVIEFPKPKPDGKDTELKEAA